MGWRTLLTCFLLILAGAGVAQTHTGIPAEQLRYGYGDGLLRNPEIRRELKFSSAQQRTMFQAQRQLEDLELTYRLRGARASSLGEKFVHGDPIKVQQLQQVDQAIIRTLTAGQKKRLRELEYQQIGPMCFLSMDEFRLKSYDEAALKKEKHIEQGLQKIDREARIRLIEARDAARKARKSTAKDWEREMERQDAEIVKERNRVWKEVDAFLKANLTSAENAKYLAARGTLFPFKGRGPGGARWN